MYKLKSGPMVIAHYNCSLDKYWYMYHLHINGNWSMNISTWIAKCIIGSYAHLIYFPLFIFPACLTLFWWPHFIIDAHSGVYSFSTNHEHNTSHLSARRMHKSQICHITMWYPLLICHYTMWYPLWICHYMMWYPLLDWPFIGALCCLLLNVVFVWHVKQWKVWQISLHDISMENKAYLIQINEGFLQYGTSAYTSSHCHCKYSYTKCFTVHLNQRN